MNPALGDLFASLDYREFLRDYYQARKEVHGYFSLRYFGNKVGMDSSFLVRVFQGKNHITEDTTQHIAKLLQMTPRETQYFETLVAFTKAKNDAQAKVFFEQLQKIRGVGYVQIEDSRIGYFEHWSLPAMRSLLDYYKFDGDFSHLAAQFQPAITEDQAKRAFFLLMELGMLRRSENEGQITYEVIDNHLHSGHRWTDRSIQDYQKQTLELAMRALEHVPKPLRDISTVTMNISGEDLGDIRNLIDEFQQNLAKLVEASPRSDRVMQLNLQLFPLTEVQS